MTVDKVIAKIIWLTFLAHPVCGYTVYPRKEAPSSERRRREDRGAEGAERVGFLGRGCPLRSRL